jgi:hypothetical protein
MATEIHQFSATIPAGTLPSALFTVPLEQANYEIESIDIEVPPGPSGLMGFYLALDDTQWIPWEQGEFIVWNDRTASWDTENQVVNAGWNVVGYNGGAYDHTITVRFHTNPLPGPPPPPYVPFTGTVVTIVTTPATADLVAS